MTSDKIIVHVSETPLVSAPQKISSALNQTPGFRSYTINMSDYPEPLQSHFTHNSLTWSNADQNTRELFRDLIHKADIIHIHNPLKENSIKSLEIRQSEPIKIYQVHSCLAGGPIFSDTPTEMGIDFRIKLVIAQAQPRMFPNYRLVPNICTTSLHLERPTEVGEKIKVIHTPSHHRGGRWAKKTSNSLEQTLKTLDKDGIIEYYQPGFFTAPYTLQSIRSEFDITIDDVFTGGFHQVAIEGLAAGNLVFSSADYFALESFKLAANTPEHLPFFTTSEDQITQNLCFLANNKLRLNQLKQKSLSYFKDHLTPKQLITRYTKTYKEALS